MCVLVRSLFMVFRSQQWMLDCCPPWYRARPLSPGSWRHRTGAAQQESVWFCHTPALVRELTLYQHKRSHLQTIIDWNREYSVCMGNVLLCADPVPGACNQEFSLDIDPNIYLLYNLFETTITFAPANIGYERWEKLSEFMNLSGHYKGSWNPLFQYQLVGKC